MGIDYSAVGDEVARRYGQYQKITKARTRSEGTYVADRAVTKAINELTKALSDERDPVAKAQIASALGMLRVGSQRPPATQSGVASRSPISRKQTSRQTPYFLSPRSPQKPPLTWWAVEDSNL